MPNLLFIMADEIRDDVTRHLRYPFVRTPRLDRLREEGTTFENTFCQFPVCVPSRASAMSGKYPHQIGAWNNNCLFPPEEITLGHHLAAQGFDTVAFGKTHGMNPGFRSVTFDVAKSLASTDHGYFADSDAITGAWDGPKDDYCDYVATNQFRDYVSDLPSDQPFAAFLGIYAPHPPLWPPREFAEMYAPDQIALPDTPEDEPATRPERQATTRAKWDRHDTDTQRRIIAHHLGMVTMVDDCVGRALQALSDVGRAEDTVVVFTSDHGEQLGEHGMLGKFHNTYEGSLRVPLILRVPGQRAAGETRSQLVELVDLFPTLCDLLGVPTPEPPHVPAGRSLVPVLTDAAAPHRHCVHSMTEHCQMVRTDTWKLALWPDDRSELYNLRDDPMERNNLYECPAHATVRTELELEIARHLIEHRRGTFNQGRPGYFG